MAHEITVPRLGWSMEEGIFSGWLKKAGEQVRAGEPLYALESDKATQQIESLDSGTLWIAPGGPSEGDTVLVGAVLGYLLEAGEQAPIAQQPPADAGGNSHAVQDVCTAPAVGASATPAPDRSGRSAISPRARRVAGALAVDWTGLRGSGSSGRIRERDIRAAAGTRTRPGTGVPGVERSEPSVGSKLHALGLEGHLVPIDRTRRLIAERMLASVRQTAPVTLSSTADATNLVNLRNQFRSAAGPSDGVPAFGDFLIKLAAAAIQSHPMMQAQWQEGGLFVPEGIHIGFAVDTPAGLVVPVLRDVRRLSLRQVSAATCDLAERAQLRRLLPAEMQGGTFTITNLGGLGIDFFSPIINIPQCAILGVGRITRQAVVDGERIVPRELISLSLTFDHRIVDGAPAARFLDTIRACIENPGPWLME